MIRKKNVALLMCLIASAAIFTSIAPPVSANNPYGVMSLIGGGDTTGMLKHFKMAHDLIGDWGYVRVGCNFEEDSMYEFIQVMAICRALKLIPVVTAFHLPREYYTEENHEVPKRDADGSLTTFENAYEDWLRKLYAHGVTIPYFEYGNEVNGGFYGDHPEIYGEMCMAASRAFKRVDPNISFGTAGMAGCALDFYEEMLTKVPELVEHVDHWGYHPYGVNHPPGYTLIFDNYGLDCHFELVELLMRFGVENPVLIATETGYELGNQRDKRFPKITEELRAKYLVDAYQNYWEPDPNVKAVMLFVLQDVRWQNWNGWDLIREDYSMTPFYEAIRDLPKPEGFDFLPAGNSHVKGRVTDDQIGRGVDDYVVWIRRPNGPYYGAITDENGYFEINNIPAGQYSISGFRDGFATSSTDQINVSEGGEVDWSIAVARPGLLSPIEGPATFTVPAGYTPTIDGHVVRMDTQVKRSGQSSLRMEANGKEGSVWQVTGYESVLPGRVYTAEVWVRTQDLVPGDGVGAALNVQITDSYARQLAVAEVPLELSGTNDWTPITIVVAGEPEARRLWVSMKVDAESGTVWFDDIFVHEASWPLPSAIDAEGDGRVSGFVTADDPAFGESVYLSNAIVSTIPLGKWTRTDWLGRYELTDLPQGEYRIVAFHPDYDSRFANVNIGQDAVTTDLVLADRSVPLELRNPDFEEPTTHPTWFQDWQKFGTTEGMQQSGWFEGLENHPQGFQARSGNGFYGVVAGSNIKDGGIFQTIAVEPHALYEVSVWSYTYQTGEGSRGDVANRLGVDPMGGRNYQSPYIIWTPIRPSHLEWSQLTLRVRPVTHKMTIFLHHLQVHGLTFNCNLFDDVEVRKIGPPDSSLAATLD